MAQTDPGTLAVIAVVAVSLLSFFTTSASERISDWESAYFKIMAVVSLVGAYILLLWMPFLLLGGDRFSTRPTLFAGLQVTYVAFIIPTGIFVLGLIDEAFECWREEEFNRGIMLGLFVLVLVIYYVLLTFQP